MDSSSVGKLVALVIAIGAVALIAKQRSSEPEYDKAACAGPPLGNAQARNDAMEKGYAINRYYDCIDKASFDEMNRLEAQARQARQEAQARPAVVPVAAAPEPAAIPLAEARRGFQTAISVAGSGSPPLPQPPAALFGRTDYRSAGNLLLPAFVTPDPKDGLRHPAVIWLTGGDTNSLDDFWTPGPPSNDQSARAFREAGVVMMFPSLRGGNANAGGKEFFFGEVDDVLAAAEHLARLPYVDPDQIHLGGHSTGGTLALLTAEASGRFRSVFAFGPVAMVNRYPASLLPVRWAELDSRETKLRSPIHWLGGITTPTYVIEGKVPPANIDDFEEICRKSTNPQVHCIAAEGSDHFSVLARVTKVIAARLAVSASGTAFTLQPDDFQQASVGADRQLSTGEPRHREQ